MKEFDKESAQALEDLESSRLSNQTESFINQTIRQLQKNRTEIAKQKSASALNNLQNIQAKIQYY